MENCEAMITPLAQYEKLSKEDGSDKVDVGMYRSLIDYLLYLIARRPNIMFTISLLPRFMHAISEMHFKAIKRVLRYVKGTPKLGVWCTKESDIRLIDYTSSDWGGSLNDMKSTSRYMYSLGFGLISGNLRKQGAMAQSIAQAKYIAIAAINQAIWPTKKKIPQDLHLMQDNAIIIFVATNMLLLWQRTLFFMEE